MVGTALIEVVPYEKAHGDYIAAHMREIDRREIYYMATLDPQRAINVTAAHAVAAWAVLLDGVPALIFGINRRSRTSLIGVPWLLATDALDEHPLALAKASKEYVARFFRAFDRMENHVLASNVKTLRWLRWLGFDMEEARPFGAFGQPFVRFGKNL